MSITGTATSDINDPARSTPQSAKAAMVPVVEPLSGAGRLHGMDAVRAFALLLGVVLHATLSNVLPPGEWGVGVAQPNLALWAFVHYTHDFRMQLFFLLAGFFGATVVARRGLRAYLRDRASRIGLVFLVLVYPIKLLISIPWIAGGLKTGWLSLPPDTARLPLVVLAIGGLMDETWPAISPGHLWFLYYLGLVTVLFVIGRAAAQRLVGGRLARAADAAGAHLARILTRPGGPLVLAVATFPILLMTPRHLIDSPDQGFIPEPAAVGEYLLFFALGWWLAYQPQVLHAFGRLWGPWLALSIATGLTGFALEVQRQTGGDSLTVAWAASAANALTLALATTGWIGVFIARLSQPSRWVRYLADASYWVYLIHLPIVLALQVWVSDWSSATLQTLVVLSATLALSLLSYDLFVRDTPIGAWLNGRRHPRWIHLKRLRA